MRVCSVCQKYHDSSVRCEVENVASDVDRDIRVDIIPGYELLELTSSKRFYDLYRAREISSQRTCLIKIISADAETSASLLSEATFAAGLFHPAIVDIYEAGELDDHRCYIVTEHATGHTLRDVLDNIGAPGLLDSIDIIRQAADALHTLHLAGLFHRAINPSNVLLSATDGGRRVVKLQHIDFGGAAQHAVVSNKFTIDSELDTLKYFAPEQVSGEGADARTDVYSLGIVFYEMLAGAPPFEAANAVALIHKLKNQSPADVRIDNFNLRMLVTHALTESLHKRPSARQSSANLLARQLRHIEQLATHVTTPPPAGTFTAPPLVEKPVAVEMMPTRYVPPSPVIVPTPLLRQIEPAVSIGIGESVSMPDPEVVSVPAADAESQFISATDNDSVPQTSSGKVTINEVLETQTSRRSRLKGWKKRLHQLASELAARAQEKRVEGVALLATAEELTLTAPASETAAEVKPRKIEWQIPDDDIPSVAAVVEALAGEGVESRFMKDEAAIAHEAIADIVEAPSDAPVIASDVILPALESIEPTIEYLVAETEPGAHLGAVAAEEVRVVSVFAAEHEPEPSYVPEPVPETKPEPVQLLRQRKPSYIQLIDVEPSAMLESSTIQEVQVEPEEEITLVRPPRGRRIRVALDRPAPPKPNLFVARKNSIYGRQQREFMPTLLGGGEQLAPALVGGDAAMFSMYPSTRAGRSYRSTFIAIGIFGLTGLLLFGNDSITRYFQTWTAADSVAGTRRESQAAIQPAPVSVTKARTSKKADKTTVGNRSTSDSAKQSTDRSAAQTKLTVSSKLVEPGTGDRNKGPAKPASSSATPTRPRVVKNP